MEDLSDRVMQIATEQFAILDVHLHDNEFPRSYDDGQYLDSGLEWWCSGLFPGSLGYVYEYTSDDKVKELAHKHTEKMKSLGDGDTDQAIGVRGNRCWW